jgi:chemotaxis protein histidine kinase CheA
MRPRSITLLRTLCWLVLGTGMARAQLLPTSPNWPIAPIDPKQCAAFAADLNRYEQEVQKQHQDCLDRPGKVDRPNLPPNSPLCSKFACQILHDRLFSESDLNSVPVLRKRLDACNAQVKEYQDQQAAQKRDAEEREQADREQAGKDQEAAESRRKAQQEERSRPVQTRISPTPASEGPANSPAALPPSQQTGQPTPEVEQARQAATEGAQKELREQTLNELADPFGKSGESASANRSSTASGDLADPFANATAGTAASDSSEPALADPFSAENSERRKAISDPGIATEEAKGIVLDTIKEKLQDASEHLLADLEAARSKLSPVNLAQYEAEVGIVTNFLDGVRHTMTTVGYAQDLNTWIRDPRNGWGPVAHDIETGGFSYLLKRVDPPLWEVYEGPVGWVASISLDSSSTQTPAQDFDPMTVLNSPAQYSFDKRVEALQQIYVSEGKHPEVWNESKCKWLYQLTLQVYNSPDNPNIHLVPQDDPNIHLAPQ